MISRRAVRVAELYEERVTTGAWQLISYIYRACFAPAGERGPGMVTSAAISSAGGGGEPADAATLLGLMGLPPPNDDRLERAHAPLVNSYDEELPAPPTGVTSLLDVLWAIHALSIDGTASASCTPSSPTSPLVSADTGPSLSSSCARALQRLQMLAVVCRNATLDATNHSDVHVNSSTTTGENFRTAAEFIVFALAQRLQADLVTWFEGQHQHKYSMSSSSGRGATKPCNGSMCGGFEPLSNTLLLDHCTNVTETGGTAHTSGPTAMASAAAAQLLLWAARDTRLLAAVRQKVLLPVAVLRVRTAGPVLGTWRRQTALQRQLLLKHAFAGWWRLVHDPYTREAHRRREVFVAGSIIAMRKRRVHLRTARAVAARVLRGAFDAWRHLAVPMGRFEAALQHRRLANCFAHWRRSKVAAMTARYGTVTRAVDVLMRWRLALCDRRYSRTLARRTLWAMRDRALIRRHQRQWTVLPLFRQWHAESQYLRAQQLGLTGDRRVLRATLRWWRLAALEKVAQRHYTHTLQRSVARRLQYLLNQRTACSHMQQVLRLNTSRRCLLRWSSLTHVLLPADREERAACEGFVKRRALVRWLRRFCQRARDRQATSHADAIRQQSLLQQTWGLWCRRTRDMSCGRSLRSAKAFQATVHCFYLWRRRYQHLHDLRTKQLAASACLAERLLQRSVLRVWSRQLQEKQRLLFPPAPTSIDAATGTASVVVVLSPEDLARGGVLRRAAFFQWEGRADHAAGRPPVEGTLFCADRHFHARMARNALSHWLGRLRLLRYLKQRGLHHSSVPMAGGGPDTADHHTSDGPGATQHVDPPTTHYDVSFMKDPSGGNSRGVLHARGGGEVGGPQRPAPALHHAFLHPRTVVVAHSRVPAYRHLSGLSPSRWDAGPAGGGVHPGAHPPTPVASAAPSPNTSYMAGDSLRSTMYHPDVVRPIAPSAARAPVSSVPPPAVVHVAGARHFSPFSLVSELMVTSRRPLPPPSASMDASIEEVSLA